jgi:hypothetical protein
MAVFIPRADNPEIPPPYEFPGITMLSFRLPAVMANLQNLCDQWLNIGTLAQRGFEYRACFDFVDLEIVTYPRMTFAESPYSTWGYATQHELYFRFFVWKLQYACGLLLPTEMPELFFPYIFVDNSWSMITGRNVIGFGAIQSHANSYAKSLSNHHERPGDGSIRDHDEARLETNCDSDRRSRRCGGGATRAWQHMALGRAWGRHR